MSAERVPNRPRLNRRLLLFIVTAGLAAALLWRARAALSPFFLGLAVAYFISPLVNRTHAALPPAVRRWAYSRPVAIVVVYLAFILVVAAAASWLLPAVAAQASELVESAPQLYDEAQDAVLGLTAEYRRLLPDEAETMVREAVDSGSLGDIGVGVLDAVRRASLATLGAVAGTFSWLLALLVVPVWLVYILNDTGRVLDGAMSLIPRALRPDVEAMRIVFDTVLSAYIRGQLIVAVILGTLFTISLLVLGVPYALLLGFVAGILAVIPFIGAFIGAVPAVAVAFVQSPELALKTVVAFVVVQQVDNLLISPRVQGDSVALSPALIMVVLVVGQQLAGVLGLLLAVPLAAVLRDVVHYLYLRADDQPAAPAEALAAVGYGDRVTPLVADTPDGAARA